MTAPPVTPIDIAQMDAFHAERIKASSSHGDFESGHVSADEELISILRGIGFEKTVEAWSEVPKWYA